MKIQSNYYIYFIRRALVFAAVLFILSSENAIAAPFIPNGEYVTQHETSVNVEQIKVTLAGKAYEGSAIDVEKIKVIYTDGLIETIPGSRIRSVYHFYVDAVANTSVSTCAASVEKILTL